MTNRFCPPHPESTSDGSSGWREEFYVVYTVNDLAGRKHAKYTVLLCHDANCSWHEAVDNQNLAKLEVAAFRHLEGCQA